VITTDNGSCDPVVKRSKGEVLAFSTDANSGKMSEMEASTGFGQFVRAPLLESSVFPVAQPALAGGENRSWNWSPESAQQLASDRRCSAKSTARSSGVTKAAIVRDSGSLPFRVDQVFEKPHLY
jgi:hypothetical protein